MRGEGHSSAYGSEADRPGSSASLPAGRQGFGLYRSRCLTAWPSRSILSSQRRTRRGGQQKGGEYNIRSHFIITFLVATLASFGLTSAAIHAQGGGFDYAVHVGSLVMDVGEDGSVELSITDIADPVGEWMIEITYDAEVISVVECLPRKGGVCDPDFGAGRLRVTGASAAGLARDTVLASITMQCERVGNSPLALTVVVLSRGPNMPAQEVQIEDGGVSCEEAAEPTSTPLPALPATGGGNSLGTAVDWPLIAIAFAALAFASGSVWALLPRRRR